MPITARKPHRQSAWGVRKNPFPTEAMGRDEDPFADEAFAVEMEELVDRVIIGGLSPRRQITFLYSHNKQGGEDTGFGKTRAMLKLRSTINEDLGQSLLEGVVEKDELVPIGAAYASFNVHQRSGYYPVLVAAVLDAASAGETPLLDHAYRRIVSRTKDDGPASIRQAILASQLRLRISLRESTVDAFCSQGAAGVVSDITTGTSDSTKLRSGIQWLHFVLVVLDAAGIRRLYMFIDQLEDLATNKTQPRARRYREIGRIRDLLEDEPSRSMLHTTFTMHDTAASDLEEFWISHRLPSYHLRKANMGQIVLFEGLRDDRAAAAVLAAWLATEREGGFASAGHAPYEMSAVRALREHAEGRVGPFVVTAGKVFDAADADRRETIDDTYTREVLGDGSISNGEPGDREPLLLADDDDLLA
jgi:hypothetical protein